MLKDQFAKLLVRKLAGEASPQEVEELQSILSDDGEAQYLSELFTIYWENSNLLSDTSDASITQDHFSDLLTQAKEMESGENTEKPIIKFHEHRNKFNAVIKRFSYAAIIVGIIAAGYWMVNYNKAGSKKITEENKKNEVVAGRGARSHLFLPDGTQVWLNSESTLRYKEKFNDSVREVELEGEAFFDVVKDKKHPFIVHTSGIDIRVLGTAFNVKSYPKEATIEATLLRGMIEVVNQNGNENSKVILKPHEKIIFDKQEKMLSKEDDPQKNPNNISHLSLPKLSIKTLPPSTPDSAVIETSWVYNKLIFDGDTFQELAVKMERWFNKRIYFKNKNVAVYRFRGVFRNENLEEALKALQLTASFTYKIDGNDVEISKKNL